MLQGQTVLILEREFLIALDIERMLESLNVREVLFARDIAEAQHLRSITPAVHLAIIEVRADPADSIDLLLQFAQADTPLVILSADVRGRTGLAELPGCPVVLKPIAEQDLYEAIGQAMARP